MDAANGEAIGGALTQRLEVGGNDGEEGVLLVGGRMVCMPQMG